ncbi:MAG: hypothetical protein WA981_01260 [Glaciecola sp.]
MTQIQKKALYVLTLLFISYSSNILSNELIIKGSFTEFCTDGEGPVFTWGKTTNNGNNGCFPISVEYSISLSTLLSEPVFRCNATWRFNPMNQRSEEYTVSESFSTFYPSIASHHSLFFNRDPDAGLIDDITPYDLEFWVDITAAVGVGGTDGTYVRCDPGVLGKEGKSSFNTAWSTNWDSTFLTRITGYFDAELNKAVQFFGNENWSSSRSHINKAYFPPHAPLGYMKEGVAKSFAKQLFSVAKKRNYKAFEGGGVLTKLKFNSLDLELHLIKEASQQKHAASKPKRSQNNQSSAASDDFWSGGYNAQSDTKHAEDDNFWSGKESQSSTGANIGDDFWSGQEDGSEYAYHNSGLYQEWVDNKRKEINSRELPPEKGTLMADTDDAGFYTQGIKECLTFEKLNTESREKPDYTNEFNHKDTGERVRWHTKYYKLYKTRIVVTNKCDGITVYYWGDRAKEAFHTPSHKAAYDSYDTSNGKIIESKGETTISIVGNSPPSRLYLLGINYDKFGRVDISPRFIYTRWNDRQSIAKHKRKMRNLELNIVDPLVINF